MGALKSNDSVDGKLSAALERLEALTGAAGEHDPAHDHPDTVEEAVRRLKGKLPEKDRRAAGD
ncbi:MAG TPA: hypothetical protein VL974_12745 [Magnetospirillum sp.]|jgi:hypothetical protein|nr:hypothetical protein [Magnetospirillum sp.]